MPVIPAEPPSNLWKSHTPYRYSTGLCFSLTTPGLFFDMAIDPETTSFLLAESGAAQLYFVIIQYDGSPGLSF
jgi:hypothetical protein